MDEFAVKKNEFQEAYELNQRIIAAAQMAQKSLYEMCVLLKQMRDGKKYKILGYDNFEEYCEEEVGVSRMQAHKYIAIIENVKNVNSSLHFGVTKLYLLSSLSESQQEEIQQKVDLEDVSVRELKAEIAKLRDSKNAAESDLLELKSKNRRLTHELEEARQTGESREQLETQLAAAQQELKTLKSNMSADTKTQEALIRQLDRQLSEADQQHANDLERQRITYQERINALQEQLDNAGYCVDVAVETVEVPATGEIFEAYCQIWQNAFLQLMQFVDGLKEEKRDYCRRIRKEISDMEAHFF